MLEVTYLIENTVQRIRHVRRKAMSSFLCLFLGVKL